jgi:phosphoglucomutase
VTKKGKTGADEIRQMMIDYRTHPPVSINQSSVVKIKDYLSSKETDNLTGQETMINLPKSDVLQFILADGSKISVRPSGTEPKIKFYFGVCEQLKSKAEFDETEKKLDKKLSDIIASMGLRK